MPATIWFAVSVETKAPRAMKQQPSRKRARAPVTIGFHSGAGAA